MNSLEFSEFLIDLHLYSGLIPVSIAFILWKYQSKEMRVFAINQVLSFSIFLFSIILQKQNINNHFIDYIHSIRTIIFVLWMYSIFDSNKNHKRNLFFVSAICVVVVLTDWGFISKNEWSELNEIALSILIATIAIYYLRIILRVSKKDILNTPIFWITVSTIIGNVSSIFSLYFAKQALNYSTEVFLIIWNILSIIGIICKLLYAVGFYVSKQKIFQ